MYASYCRIAYYLSKAYHSKAKLKSEKKNKGIGLSLLM